MIAFFAPLVLLWLNDALCYRSSNPCDCDAIFQYRMRWPANHARIVAQGLFALALGIVGVRTCRGRPTAFWIPTVLALSPMGLALWEVHRHEQEMAAVLAGTDETIALAAGGGGIAGFMVFAGHLGTLLLLQLNALQIAAFSAGPALLAVAVTASLTLPAAAPAGALRKATFTAGALAAAAVGLARAAAPARPSWLDAFGLALVLAAPLVAVAANRSIPRDPRQRGHAFGSFVLAAFAFAAAVLLLETPACLLEVRAQLSPVIGDCGQVFPTTPSFELPPRLLHLVVDAAAALVVFLPGLRARTRERNELGLGAIVVPAAVALLVLAGAMLWRRVTNHVAMLHEPDAIAVRVMARAHVTLPTFERDPEAEERQAFRGHSEPIRWIVTPHGLIDPWLEPDLACSGSVDDCRARSANRRAGFPFLRMLEASRDVRVAVAADTTTPVEVLIRELRAAHPAWERGVLAASLALAPRVSHAAPNLGGVTRILGSELAELAVSLNARLVDLTRSRADGDLDIVVFASGDILRRFEVHHPTPQTIEVTSDWPPPEGTPTPYPSRHAHVIIAPRPGTTVGELVALLRAYAGWTERVVITADRAPLEAAVAAWDARPPAARP